MTVPLDDLLDRVHDQIVNASDRIDARRTRVEGRTPALTAVDLEIPVEFLEARPEDAESTSGTKGKPPDVAVSVDGGDGVVRLSFRPRPSPDDADDTRGAASDTVPAAEASTPERAWRAAEIPQPTLPGHPPPTDADREPTTEPPGSGDGDEGVPPAENDPADECDASDERDASARTKQSAAGEHRSKDAGTREKHEASEDRGGVGPDPSDGRAERGRPHGSTLDRLRSMGASPTTARLLVRRGIDVDDLRELDEHALHEELREAVEEAAEVDPETYSPDVRELSRILARAEESAE